MPSRPRDMRTTPRQERSLETRERLIEAGRTAFADLGHEGVNLARDILGPAEVSVGSFYHQFNDKTELLVVILLRAADLRREAVIDGGLAREDAGPLDERLATAMTKFFDSLDDETHAWRLLLNVRQSADERIRAVDLNGREEWLRQLSAVLADATGADADHCRAAATMLVSFAMGLALVYFDLTPRQRKLRRKDFLANAITVVTAAVPAVLRRQGGPP